MSDSIDQGTSIQFGTPETGPEDKLCFCPLAQKSPQGEVGRQSPVALGLTLEVPSNPSELVPCTG